MDLDLIKEDDDISARLNLGKTINFANPIGGVDTGGWIDDQGNWHAGIEWSKTFGEPKKIKKHKTYSGTSLGEFEEAAKKSGLFD